MSVVVMVGGGGEKKEVGKQYMGEGGHFIKQRR